MNTEPYIQKFEAFVAKLQKEDLEFRERLRSFIPTQPPTKKCERHPDVDLPINFDRSVEASKKAPRELRAGYELCPRCEEEKTEKIAQKKLREQGVTLNLLHATITNWNAESDVACHRENVRIFAEKKRGFLILMGDYGTGKSHLAVGAMRYFNSARFIKHDDLLRKLRFTYNDRNAENPIETCQQCGLLVLDDVGTSSGGRDEQPMIHSILAHRHDERKPTIITSNLCYEEFQESIGGRMADRLKESSHMIIQLSGASYRPLARENYFN